ncbi:hypothetical protein GWK47_009245 [Chionoecetes opilio]|uniref:Protein kinase domain-containing protein n=1 Tax=Chionoecetes opilio TaxID=41210 RepID=A0A8J4XYT8_CHIOP|nr:hypothetical protein GWK47_009245 [Chionoecetes opilio]
MLRGDPVFPASDVYSVGCLVIRLATGSSQTEVTAPLKRIAYKCLAQDGTQRPALPSVAQDVLAIKRAKGRWADVSQQRRERREYITIQGSLNEHNLVSSNVSLDNITFYSEDDGHPPTSWTQKGNISTFYIKAMKGVSNYELKFELKEDKTKFPFMGTSMFTTSQEEF